MVMDELTYNGCNIYEINADGSGGGDVIDFRGASSITSINVTNNTIYTGFRTFLRLDANVKATNVLIKNNTMMNICFVENANNSGIIGIKVEAQPSSLVFSNNIVLYEEGSATVVNTSDKNTAEITFSNNYYYGCVDTFFERVTVSGATAGGGKVLTADPCYNSKGGMFNLVNTEASTAQVGAPQWFSPYVEEPEDLTLPLTETAKTWDFTNAKYFIGDITKSKVRDNLLMSVSDNKMKVQDGIMVFNNATTVSKKGLPTDGYLAFKVNKPGSVYLIPTDVENEDGAVVRGNHIIVSVGDVAGTTNSVKGGAAMNVAMSTAQKILINDITEESIIYVYASGNIGLSGLAWALDTAQVNTALPSPEPTVDPASIQQGTASDVTVSWPAVDNAASYSVVFNGKSYPVSDGVTSYVIASDVIKFLDAGGYMISVYANPGDDDIYNTQSSAGKTALTVLAKSGGGSEEFVVSSVADLVNAIASGKIDITLAFSTSAYDIGTLALTTPLRLKGQTKNGAYTPIKGNFSISGDLGGSLILRNLDVDGTDAAGAFIVETEAVTADTIAMINCNISNSAKALYDNSKKYASNVQYMIFDGIQVDNCSNAADFIDMRNGAYHNLIITRSTFANSARTFIRTDAASEINYATIRNNTFYKLCTIESSKDNNGLFHIRGTAGSGMLDFQIVNNLFYSIKISTDPSNANGYPKFISKNAAALKPNSIRNNYFYNIEEDKADYTWWTANCTKEEGIAGGGCVLATEPCKDPDKGDYTLTNAVAMNANIGDPRWNPMAGGTPSSEITVENVGDLLTAISAGKSTITLAPGTYDFTSITESADVTGGVLTLSTSLNLIGQNGAIVIGGFKMAAGITKMSATGISFIGKSGETTISNMIDISTADVTMSSVALKNCSVSAYGNRMFSMSAASTVTSIDFSGLLVFNMGTSGDFIDIRKGNATAIRVANSTFYNGIRTFMRIDAAVVCGSINVQNNTFFNLCSVDSKDNNGIFHVRATSVTSETFIVKKNLFAGMHRAVETPSNANGYPKITSSNTANIIPTYSGNYYYDFDTTENYSWWTRTDEAVGTAGYGVILTTDPFASSGTADFTLTNALAMSENVGDPRWNPTHGGSSDDPFDVASVSDLLTALSAGKTYLRIAGGTYDFTAAESENIAAGVLSLSSSLKISGVSVNGAKPEIIGAFKFTGTGIKTFTLEGIKMTGTNEGGTVIGNMLDISDETVNMTSIVLKNCEVSKFGGRLLSMSVAATLNYADISGLLVSEMGTSGDFIDVRKGTLNLIKVSNNTFYNGIRTFIRMDAAVICGSVSIVNNTFYNLCSVDSKDNNGILHVRSTALPAEAFIVEKNIFATMHRAVDTPSNANGYPKIVSNNAAGRDPVFRSNLYFDFDTTDNLSWWSRIDEAAAIANGGAVLSATPFAGDPTTGKFTVTAEYKGYGDLRW